MLKTVECSHSRSRIWGPVWARERCRISPPRFLAECCKKQLNQDSFVLLYFRLFTFFWFVLSLFICIFLHCFVCQFVRLWRPPPKCCVEWGVKLYSNQPNAGFGKGCYAIGLWFCKSCYNNVLRKITKQLFCKRKNGNSFFAVTGGATKFVRTHPTLLCICVWA